jgi:diphthine synthase
LWGFQKQLYVFLILGCCGLQLYSFGETVSIPFWSEDWTPDSFYDKITSNLERGMHTLCLLDIKVAERTIENMMRNRKIYEPPRFMTVNQASDQLLKIFDQRNSQGTISGDTLAIGVARVGQDDQKLVAGTLKQLLNIDMGLPLHSLVIPGHLHILEKDAVNLLKIDS